MVISSFYAFAAKGINARFLLPMFPFLCIVAALAVITLGQKLPNPRWRWTASLVIIILLVTRVQTKVDELLTRNANDAVTVMHVQNIVAQGPKDAVWMSYGLNDQIAVYGQRSVLNYRRIVQFDPETGSYNPDVFDFSKDLKSLF